MSDKPEINEAGRAGGLVVSPFSASYFDAERLALLEAGARVLGNAECRRLADEIRGNQNMPPMNMPDGDEVAEQMTRICNAIRRKIVAASNTKVSHVAAEKL